MNLKRYLHYRWLLFIRIVYHMVMIVLTFTAAAVVMVVAEQILGKVFAMFCLWCVLVFPLLWASRRNGPLWGLTFKQLFSLKRKPALQLLYRIYAWKD